MKRLFLSSILVCLACLFAFGEKTYKVDDVPNVFLTDSRFRVSDPDGLLSQTARDSINYMLQTLDRRTGIEVAVVMLSSIGASDPFDFAHELFRKWGIGSRRTNNGLLFLYVEDIHRIRITVGDGLEGTMTDAMSKRIIDRHMIPHFRVGDRDGGMQEGVRMACGLLDGTMQPEQDEDDFPATIGLLLIFSGMAVMLFTFWLTNKLSRRCPHCGKIALRRTNTKKYKKNGVRYVCETYVCEHCGHITQRTSKDSNGNITGGMGAGPVIFGGGRSSGGGFSGGSWGGGTTSGGGASGGW